MTHPVEPLARCPWASGEDTLYTDYHDQEWGRPEVDDIRLFEKLCLEGFQAGLSWLTILRKRERFRVAFAGFDPNMVAAFDDDDLDRLLHDPGIVRHRGKITAAINNAGKALELVDEFGSVAAYVWGFEPVPDEPATGAPRDIPSTSAESMSLSRDLKRRGWAFVGPTTMYAFMQAMGLVNDHIPECWAHAEVNVARANLERPARRRT